MVFCHSFVTNHLSVSCVFSCHANQDCPRESTEENPPIQAMALKMRHGIPHFLRLSPTRFHAQSGLKNESFPKGSSGRWRS